MSESALPLMEVAPRATLQKVEPLVSRFLKTLSPSATY